MGSPRGFPLNVLFLLPLCFLPSFLTHLGPVRFLLEFLFNSFLIYTITLGVTPSPLYHDPPRHSHIIYSPIFFRLYYKQTRRYIYLIARIETILSEIG